MSASPAEHLHHQDQRQELVWVAGHPHGFQLALSLFTSISFQMPALHRHEDNSFTETVHTINYMLSKALTNPFIESGSEKKKKEKRKWFCSSDTSLGASEEAEAEHQAQFKFGEDEHIGPRDPCPQSGHGV